MKSVYSVDVNNFSLQIEGANLLQRPEDGAYFAEIEHGAHFAVAVQSNWGHSKSPFECEMTLNGEKLGVFQGSSRIRVETKPDSGKKLTAFVKGSAEAYQAGQSSSFSGDVGLIKLVMFPSKEKDPYLMDFFDVDCNSRSLSKGATRGIAPTPMQIGLQGKSDQTFKTVASIDRDYSNETTVYIRLIEKNSSYNEITPLNEVKKETPYPRL